MKNTPSRTRVAVTSRSFSKNLVLREELLRRYDNVTFNDAGTSLSGTDLLSFLQGHEKAIVALERIDADLVAGLPELQVISKYGVGLDNIDVDALNRHGNRMYATVKVELDALAPGDLRQAFIDGIRSVTTLPDVALASTQASLPLCHARSRRASPLH